MNKKILTAMLLALKAAKIFNPSRFQRSMVDLARLKASLMYVKSIETFRLLFLHLLAVAVCLIFFAASLALFHTTIFLYAPLSAQAKMWVGLTFTLLYFGIAATAFSFIFSETQWLKIFNAEDVTGDQASKTSEEDFSRNKSTYKESGPHN